MALSAVVASVGGLIFKASAANKAAATAGVAVGASKLGLAIAGAVKLATTVIGVGKLTILPFLVAAIAYYNYDLFDPENRPFNVQKVDRSYDFIIIGGGSAGSVLASRLSEIPQWKVLLLEAGGHETEITDVPLLSLYLHTSKLDWKYRFFCAPEGKMSVASRLCDSRLANMTSDGMPAPVVTYTAIYSKRKLKSF
uniref:Uncharacterized protein n=1 Tax=Glossina morsitans morsitans TaxID=37546 RepID=A0A1B0FBA3_GLOMM